MKIKPGLETEYEQYKLKNSSDDYSAAVVKWHEDAAAVMEQEFEKGVAIADSAKGAFRATDKGYTGFMYDCVIQALSYFWIHGDALRKWHNRRVLKDTIAADVATEQHEVASVSMFTIKA